MERQDYLPPHVTTKLKCLISQMIIINNQPTVFQDTTDQDATDSTPECGFFFI